MDVYYKMNSDGKLEESADEPAYVDKLARDIAATLITIMHSRKDELPNELFAFLLPVLIHVTMGVMTNFICRCPNCFNLRRDFINDVHQSFANGLTQVHNIYETIGLPGVEA